MPIINLNSEKNILQCKVFYKNKMKDGSRAIAERRAAPVVHQNVILHGHIKIGLALRMYSKEPIHLKIFMTFHFSMDIVQVSLERKMGLNESLKSRCRTVKR